MANIEAFFKNTHVVNSFNNYIGTLKTRIGRVVETVEASREENALPPLSPVQKVTLISNILDTAALADEDTWAVVTDVCLGMYGFDDVGVPDDEEDF